MEINNTDILLLLLHVVLLIVKTYATYYFLSLMVLMEAPNKTNVMFIFKPLEFLILVLCLITAITEIYYISYFFIDVPLYLYEYLSIQDQIILTVLWVYHFKKGG